jgi:hypothetical protein
MERCIDRSGRRHDNLAIGNIGVPDASGRPLNGTSMNLLPAFTPLLPSVVAGLALCTSRSVVVRTIGAPTMSFRAAPDTRQCRYATARDRSNALRFPQCAQPDAVRAAT